MCYYLYLGYFPPKHPLLYNSATMKLLIGYFSQKTPILVLYTSATTCINRIFPKNTLSCTTLLLPVFRLFFARKHPLLYKVPLPVFRLFFVRKHQLLYKVPLPVFRLFFTRKHPLLYKVSLPVFTVGYLFFTKNTPSCTMYILYIQVYNSATLPVIPVLLFLDEKGLRGWWRPVDGRRVPICWDHEIHFGKYLCRKPGFNNKMPFWVA